MKTKKDYSSYYEIDENGVTKFLKAWEVGKHFTDLDKELPLMLEQNRIGVYKWKRKNETMKGGKHNNG